MPEIDATVSKLHTLLSHSPNVKAHWSKTVGMMSP